MVRSAATLVWATLVISGCARPAPGEQDARTAAPRPEQRPIAPRPLTYPVRAALAADGTLYISDTGADAVFGYQGTHRVFEVGVERPLGVAVAGERLWVGSAGRRRVVVFATADGAFLFDLHGEIELPNAIAVTPDGKRVYVADSRANAVLVYDAAGNLTGSFGGDGTLRFPAAIAVDATRVVVADQGHHRVQVFARDGGRLGSFGSLPSGTDLRGGLVRPQGIALVGDDIAVLDSYFGVVQLFTAGGTSRGFVGGRGDCDTCVDLALDVVWDPAALRFVILDPNRRRWASVPFDPRVYP